MQYIGKYFSPLGEITIAADEIGLTGLWFVGQKYYACCLDKEVIQKETSIIKDTKKWLDIYFQNQEPNFHVSLHVEGTDFQKEVWDILLSIPYGNTITYSQIANIIAKNRNIPKMSAQAVGGAVGHNPISIIIPCHRVIGSSGNLTGYAGGIEKKKYLLTSENIDIQKLHEPKKVIHNTASIKQ